jgi:hypothetical protein
MKNLICILAILFSFTSFAHAEPTVQVEAKFGGISSDNLGGIGGSKATAELSSNICFTYLCVGGSVWAVTEGMDDDIGIVPQNGFSLEVTSSGFWLYGVQHRSNDFFSQTSGMLGVSHGPVRLAVLVPLSTDRGTGRTGFTGVLRTPLTKKLYAVVQYDYYGTQDPDMKVSQVGLGVGYTFK